ncbi:MAG: cysteine desulfurase NifS [Candidatus Yanofskybacteria bacterium CG10_big_fil_rev_8_21_14_0_10_36_16]|uniref:Cysteine desulfurase NifS n=1 Tax=Candidatus Yanofskybacteria bacterium CG10_big_fil_rev_8_21_14_0_10_36_16 TaxID=1975096 RepID=A0A2J0Q6F3_9BACT|nr:MAG: cysteine desulfurase NifS [Candidatus Yanofskybacteria bacterium CG10_big_fil_rev_8_21_14_0_10_36_16]
MKRIYLDNAAATPLDPRVKREMDKYEKAFGNASSLYASGKGAKKIINNSREKIAKILNAGADEIIFTGSGTESCNLAVLGAARANKKKGKHIITTKIEHHAVLNACKQLEQEGFKITCVNVNEGGLINPEDVKKALNPNTVLVSIMYANNEIGTIQPIQQIAKIIKNFNKQIIFHTDATQAVGYLDLNVQKLGIDSMSFNGSKIYGPKGAGCLYIRRGTTIQPIMFGGSQERGLRPGTENTALIAGFAKALEITDSIKEKENNRLKKLRDYTIDKIINEIPSSKLNGSQKERLPNNINMSFAGKDGEMLVLILDQKGVEVSTGSACTSTEIRSENSGQADPSHVLKAIRWIRASHHNQAKGESVGTGDNLRITLGRFTKKEDIDYFIKQLKNVLKS